MDTFTSPRNTHWTYYTALIIHLSSDLHIAYLPRVRLSKKQTEALLNLIQIEVDRLTDFWYFGIICIG